MNKKKKTLNKNRLNFWIYVSPWIIGFSVFTLFPMLLSVVLSFTNARLISVLKGFDFIRADNYIFAFTKDTAFISAIKNTLIYAVLNTTVITVAAFLLALLLNSVHGKKVFRTMAYAPIMIPVVGSTLLWRLIIIQDHSLMSYVFSLFGKSPNFFSEDWALLTVVVIDLMTGVGSPMIIFLAALQGVSQELLEASELDGANGPQRLFWVTIPLIGPSFFFVLVTRLIDGFQAYANVALLTGGGPNNATITMTMAVLLNFKSLDNHALGLACAESWVVCLIIMAVTLIFFKTVNKKIYYGA